MATIVERIGVMVEAGAEDIMAQRLEREAAAAAQRLREEADAILFEEDYPHELATEYTRSVAAFAGSLSLVSALAHSVEPIHHPGYTSLHRPERISASLIHFGEFHRIVSSSKRGDVFEANKSADYPIFSIRLVYDAVATCMKPRCDSRPKDERANPPVTRDAAIHFDMVKKGSGSEEDITVESALVLPVHVPGYFEINKGELRHTLLPEAEVSQDKSLMRNHSANLRDLLRQTESGLHGPVQKLYGAWLLDGGIRAWDRIVLEKRIALAWPIEELRGATSVNENTSNQLRTIIGGVLESAGVQPNDLLSRFMPHFSNLPSGDETLLAE